MNKYINLNSGSNNVISKCFRHHEVVVIWLKKINFFLVIHYHLFIQIQKTILYFNEQELNTEKSKKYLRIGRFEMIFIGCWIYVPFVAEKFQSLVDISFRHFWRQILENFVTTNTCNVENLGLYMTKLHLHFVTPVSMPLRQIFIKI